MRCEKAQELFSDYCEGALQPAMTHTLEAHLGECAQCRAEVEGLKRVWATLDAAEIIEPPANFRETIWGKIDALGKQAASPRQERRGFSLQSFFTKRALAWAGAAIVVLVLTPFVIPGKYSPAWLINFTEIFRGQPERTWVVTAQPATISAEDRQVIKLPITIDSPNPVRVALRIESGPARLLKPDTHALLRAGETHTVDLHVNPDSSGKPIVLQLDWNQNGETKSKVFNITAP